MRQPIRAITLTGQELSRIVDPIWIKHPKWLQGRAVKHYLRQTVLPLGQSYTIVFVKGSCLNIKVFDRKKRFNGWNINKKFVVDHLQTLRDQPNGRG